MHTRRPRFYLGYAAGAAWLPGGLEWEFSKREMTGASSRSHSLILFALSAPSQVAGQLMIVVVVVAQVLYY